MSITVYGASDDLIEVEGDITEEFPYRDDNDDNLLAFSNGTVLRIRFDAAGVWRISPVMVGAGLVDIVQAPEGDEDNYSDRATVTGAAWVGHGIGWAK